MSKVTVRADELCGKHIGMYVNKAQIHSIRQYANEPIVVRSDDGQTIREYGQSETVTLSDSPTPDLPTDPGSMVVATVGKEQYRVVLTRIENDEMWEWLHESGEGWNDFDLSDPVELVAVPKKEYEALLHAMRNEPHPAFSRAAFELVKARYALESSLS